MNFFYINCLCVFLLMTCSCDSSVSVPPVLDEGYAYSCIRNSENRTRLMNLRELDSNDLRIWTKTPYVIDFVIDIRRGIVDTLNVISFWESDLLHHGNYTDRGIDSFMVRSFSDGIVDSLVDLIVATGIYDKRNQDYGQIQDIVEKYGGSFSVIIERGKLNNRIKNYVIYHCSKRQNSLREADTLLEPLRIILNNYPHFINLDECNYCVFDHPDPARIESESE